MGKKITTNMLESSSLFYDCMKIFYDATNDVFPLSFEEMMESNENRLDYLIVALDKLNNLNVNKELLQTLKSTITYIYTFITKGIKDKTIKIPQVYAENMNTSSIIPSQEDLNLLFQLISLIDIIHTDYYKDKKLELDLPNKTFNQGMTRIISIERRSLPHLMGLTENSNKPNYLKTMFIERDKKTNPEHYDLEGKYIDEKKTISERLLDYILSSEGQKDIIELNNRVISFKEKDIINNPDSYDEFGNIKQKSLPSFKERLKEETGLDFPIIKYSRYITKCVNLANFLNMYNLYEMVLDYRGVEKFIKEVGGEQDIKDLFLVNSLEQEITHFISIYHILHDGMLKSLERYAKTDSVYEKQKIERFLKSHNLDINKYLGKDGIDTPLKTFLDFHNQSHLIDESIDPDFTFVHKIIDDALQSEFIRSVYMLGFDSEYRKDEQRNSLDIIPLDETSVISSHCDTSISINVVDLISKYHKYGRAFFLDKVVTDEGKCLRISRPEEKINYRKLLTFLGEEQETKSLEVRLKLLEQQYKTFIQNLKINGINETPDDFKKK